jgi:hypothetical protein
MPAEANHLKINSRQFQDSEALINYTFNEVIYNQDIAHGQIVNKYLPPQATFNYSFRIKWKI